MTDPSSMPSLKRRLAAFVYEGVLLFGVAVVTGLLFSPLVGQRNAMNDRLGLMAAVGSVFTLYFVYFWSKSGQTLAMQTWRLRVVDLQGQALTWRRALVRSLLGWLWFLPALLLASALGLRGSEIYLSVVLGLAIYVLLAWLHPQQRFVHEILSRTQTVTQLPKSR
jgi:uncharacterized RDD family membrane protein YckC